jgi:UDP-3-O-[3-hydroxymyristoyl] glucosamine N-acyltransferase
MIEFQHLDASEISSLIPGVELAGCPCVFASLGLVDTRATGRVLTYAESEGFVRAALRNQAVAGIVTSEQLYRNCAAGFGNRCAVLVDNPREAFWNLHLLLFHRTEFYRFAGAGAPAEIGQSQIARSAVIEDGVRIGDRCVVGDHVVIHANTGIGDDVVIRANTVVGCEGFEYKWIAGRRVHMPHDAGVQIGDGVEIGTQCAIERGMLSRDTVLGEQTKLNNLVQVAHSSHIGQRCLLAASAVVGGSTQMGDEVWIGPGAVISNNLRIGRHANVSLGAVVVDDVPERQKVTGNFAVRHDAFLRQFMDVLRAASPLPGGDPGGAQKGQA